jgi:high-affinity iron transporter
MLLDSVVLILREVLEAAALVSVLLALSRSLEQQGRWVFWALAAGAIATFSFASNLESVTDALDGSGQEVANAVVQLGVYILALAIVTLSARGRYGTAGMQSSSLSALMIACVACAVFREGAEIFVFVSGFTASAEYRTAVFAGSFIGAGIGVSLGILLYSGLRALAPGTGYRTAVLLLGLIGAGMAMQATILLEQIDWLPAGRPIWDSSWLIDEQSIAGELLYAVFGYEATPGGRQVVAYLAGLCLMLAGYLFGSNSGLSQDAH